MFMSRRPLYQKSAISAFWRRDALCRSRILPGILGDAVRKLLFAPRDEVSEAIGDAFIQLRFLIIQEHRSRLLATARVVVLGPVGIPLFEGVEVHQAGHEESRFKMLERVLGAEEMA